MTSQLFLIHIVVLLLVYCSISTVDAVPVPSLRYYSRNASPALKRVLNNVRYLQSVLICQSNPQLSKQRPCPSFNASQRMPFALRRLSSVAKRERLNLFLQSPSYRTTIVEPYNGEPADATILLLHGFSGTVENELSKFLPLIRCGFLPRTRIVIPQAYPGPNTFFNTTNLPSWFDLPLVGQGPWRNDQIFGAAGNVSSLLDTVSATMGVTRARSGIIGTSQGAILTSVVYLRHYVAAATMFVGLVAPPDAYPNEMTTLSQNSPLLMINGVEDKLIPIVEGARRSVAIFRALGRNVTYKEIPGVGHSLGDRRVELTQLGMKFVREGIDGHGDVYRNINFTQCLTVDPPIWQFD